MGKFFGKIGFSKTTETSPGIWTEDIIERDYYGEINKVSRRWSNGQNLNDNIEISNEFSILGDAYAMENLHTIRYIVWMGVKWKVSSIDIQPPRLNMMVGGVYNAQPT